MKHLLGFLILFFSAPLFSQITITGKVTDANGNAPILAHAHWEKYNDAKNTTSVECSKDGHYSIHIPKAGMYSLRISAVNHQEINIPLILVEKDKTVEINVQLHANPFNKDPEKITVIGDWNKFAFASNEMMTPLRATDALTYYRYERIATGDTLSYQLMGIAEGGHSVNGSQADSYSYDGGGDYRSVIRTHKGDNVTITFDPSKMQYSDNNNLPIVEIKNNAFLKKTYDLTKAIEKMQQEAMQKPAGGGAVTMSAEKYKAILASINKTYQDAVKSDDTKFSQFAAVMLAKQYDPEMPFNSGDAAMILRAVPTSSSLWLLAPNEVMEVLSLVETGLATSYKKGLEKNPERSVRAVAFAGEMEHAVKAKDEKEWKRLYRLLKKDYDDVAEIKWEMANNNPDAVVMVGKSVPSFEVALLDGSGKVSNTSMLGKYYMIDFWATWCGPCVREMPAIHKAYEKFKGKKGFEIISLSMDAAQTQIAPFRAKKWKMPWLHAFITGIFEAELAKKFEVAGIPKPILVGPDGKIITMQEDLRGEVLEKTLAKYLGESN